MSSVCGTCGKDASYGEIISAIGLKFHVECFKCAGCNEPLSAFYSCEDKPYCEKCIDDAEERAARAQPAQTPRSKAAAETCGRCSLPADFGVVVTAINKKWHQDCFTCGICAGPLDGFFGFEGQPYCAEHIDEAEAGGAPPPVAALSTAPADSGASGHSKEEDEARKQREHEERERQRKQREEGEREEKRREEDARRKEEQRRKRQDSERQERDADCAQETEQERLDREWMERRDRRLAEEQNKAAGKQSDSSGEVERLNKRIAELEQQLAAANARADAAEARLLSSGGAGGAPAAVVAGGPPPPPPPGAPPPPAVLNVMSPRKLKITKSGQSRTVAAAAQANPQADLMAEMASKGRSRLRRVAARPSKRDLANKGNRLQHKPTGKVDPSLVKGADTGNEFARNLASNAERSAVKAVDRQERVKQGNLKKRHNPHDKFDNALNQLKF